MYSHLTIGSNDLKRAGIFYDALLIPLGLRQRAVEPDGGPLSLCWIIPGNLLPRFYVYEPYDGQPATSANGGMVAFLAPSPEAVDKSYQDALENGGACEGPPGERAQYGAGYYGAYLRDPDGNKIHIVYRGDIQNR